MKLFVAHSSSYDFQSELYLPLRSSKLNDEHEIVLPQEKGYEVITVDIIKNSDAVIAEVSYPSTGSGIELGWAYLFKKPIICIYKEGMKYSSSLTKITNIFISYNSPEQMIDKITEELKKA